MKKNLIALTLLAVATGAMIAACGPTTGSGDDPSVGVSSSEPPVSSSESSEEEIEATRATVDNTKIPSVFVVGETFKISEVVTFTPATANKYVVTSTNEAVATVTDNELVTIVGAGEAKVQIKKTGGSVLAQITVVAMTEAGKALQEFCDGLSNNYAIDATWNQISGVWADAAEGVEYSYTEGMGMLVTENYVVDGVYEAYSAIALEKAGGDVYGYSLKTAGGTDVSFADGLEAALNSAAKVEIDEKVSSAYLNSYFVMEGLLSVTDYTEGEDGWFTLTDGTTAQTLIGNLLGMSVTNYTGVSAKVKLTEGVLSGVVKFDAKATTGCALEFTLKKDVTVALLENAVKNAEPPAKLDVTELASHYATFQNNFQMTWKCGVFNKSLQHVDLGNAFGTSLFTENTWLDCSLGFTEEGAADLENADISGYTVDATGLHEVYVDEDGTIVKDEAVLSTSYATVYDLPFVNSPAALFTSTVLDAADLVVAFASATQTQYTYNAAFDTGAIGYAIESLSPVGYKFVQQVGGDVGRYGPLGLIIDAGTAIRHAFALNYDGTNVLGYDQTLSKAGKVVEPIGQKVWEAFPSYFSAPSAE